MTNKLHIAIKPMGAVRTTRKTVVSGKSEAYKRYHTYKEAIRCELAQVNKGELLGAIRINKIVFYMPIPDYLKKHVVEGDPHLVKPDVDNLLKGVLDAFNANAWSDDNRVYKVCDMEKVYSHTPGIYIEYEQTHELPSVLIKRAAKTKSERAALKEEHKKIIERRRKERQQ